MAYIREKETELTGYQAGSPYAASVDVQCDFVMVYGIDRGMPERIGKYREKGYVVHLMTGIAWGNYQDYLNGQVDGREHWDEAQTDRSGNQIIHNPTVPYMVPTVAFSDFLTERLKVAVDAGVEAIHVEEPEFFDHGGYSPAFRREYEIYYREKWTPPHESLDARYKSTKLKAYLYSRAIARVSASLKEYAMAKYGRMLRFYVPTHSLLNYTQWKIISPEAQLVDIPTLDGFIAQIWTGTSRTSNIYEGLQKERTFETAYLEYGIMQELVQGSGKRMWFLHDPIEDAPGYTWENYEYNYLKTVVASLLHPKVHHYEICPWPHRVFEGIYPRYQPNITKKDETSFAREDSKPIPRRYATVLSNIFQMLGDMDQSRYAFESSESGVGVLMSDSGLYQRTFPDTVVSGAPLHHALRQANGNIGDALRDNLSNEQVLWDFVQSGTFPPFYGMTLPLLKYGLCVRPVQLENIRRFYGYLKDYSVLILSYEYIKPESPDINAAIALWVKNGGTVIYIGDDRDPYHTVDGWWRKAGFASPAQHLFETLEISCQGETGTYQIGAGTVAVWKINPSLLCLSHDIAEKYRAFVKAALAEKNYDWVYSNAVTLSRGPYIISAVMDESVHDAPKRFSGLFADMLTDSFAVIREKTVCPDGNTVLFDFSKIENEKLRVIGTSARIFRMEICGQRLELECKAADKIKVYMRLRLPSGLSEVTAYDEGNTPVSIHAEWDEQSRTALLCYESRAETIKISADLM